jgi:SAM-dependent methyltransferase
MRSITSFFRRPAVRDEGLIDVKQLIRQLPDAELLKAADGYFSGLNIDSEQCHKPFSNPGDAIHITRHLSLLLEAANLFPGADVLDFGCATGWLTLALAELGSNAVGVDISPSAVALAEQLKARQSDRPGGSSRFLAYDGQRLPLEDETLDRVVCFDAFHHVKDQPHVLREFARVLRPGGRIAMVEPGPNHSRTRQSQMEMTRYKVIENDIVMADIAVAAAHAGLSAPQMLVQFQTPTTVPLELFEQWSAPGLPGHAMQQLLTRLKSELTNTQCFFIAKGEAAPDSRQAAALAADLQLVSVDLAHDGGNSAELRFRIRNTGEATWITEPGRAGQVNLGSQLVDRDGSVIDLNHGRYGLGVEKVLPGAVIDLVVNVQRPQMAGAFLRFDLVSELVAWFEQMGRSGLTEWRPAP